MSGLWKSKRDGRYGNTTVDITGKYLLLRFKRKHNNSVIQKYNIKHFQKTSTTTSYNIKIVKWMGNYDFLNKGMQDNDDLVNKNVDIK